MSGVLVVAIYFGSATTSADARAIRKLATVVNPCSGVPEQTRYLAKGLALDIATDSLYHQSRTRLGIGVWERDSVVATSDSVVCTHLDSLISLWLATPAADSLGVERVSWWTNMSAVRVNPGKYFVRPTILVDDATYNFVVDSVRGQVRFFRTPH